ncbi:hypothetical protein [Cryobacterium sp.]|jgi:hypothetical protein|uniref:hypothetical protein n=1 Tax=Cryobacterium sp. TaxID=1926290 RepID=UPI002605F0C3|nr:hypothetical protein [Cryobacterium sp.]MCU1445798.1 hypothetical protein [Cryobacterium sp.]
MINTPLRRPSGVAEVTADALRAVALVGIVVASVGWGPIPGASLALVAGGMLLPRLLGVRPSVDIAFGVVVLVAVWSSVLDIYITTRWWDLPVHLVTNGLCAALLYIVLVQFSVVADAATLPRPMLSTVVVTTALGLALGVFWEIFEWIGHTFLDPEIYVGYTDSIGDLVWGGAGAVLAGCCMRYLNGSPTAASTAASSAPPSPG